MTSTPCDCRHCAHCAQLRAQDQVYERDYVTRRAERRALREDSEFAAAQAEVERTTRAFQEARDEAEAELERWREACDAARAAGEPSPASPDLDGGARRRGVLLDQMGAAIAERDRLRDPAALRVLAVGGEES